MDEIIIESKKKICIKFRVRTEERYFPGLILEKIRDYMKVNTLVKFAGTCKKYREFYIGILSNKYWYYKYLQRRCESCNYDEVLDRMITEISIGECELCKKIMDKVIMIIATKIEIEKYNKNRSIEYTKNISVKQIKEDPEWRNLKECGLHISYKYNDKLYDQGISYYNKYMNMEIKNQEEERNIERKNKLKINLGMHSHNIKKYESRIVARKTKKEKKEKLGKKINNEKRMIEECKEQYKIEEEILQKIMNENEIVYDMKEYYNKHNLKISA
jgi:hypothetical protein